ncbi:MAG: hypothetical protein JNL90_20155, partial [Planctomycetes bacterium]|nr:hypothetical protein [Planctomycetota bacterium]
MSEPPPSSPEPAVERRARTGPPDGVERRARPAEAHAASAPPASAERRNVPGAPGFVERRRRPTPMLSRFTFVGGRRGSDPSTPPDESYVDVYDARSAILVLVFFGLTVFDAIATVYYIDHVQGSEWNPIADWLLQQGRLFFVLGKGVPTGLLLL